MNDTIFAALGLTAEEAEAHNSELRDLVLAWMRSRDVRTHELLAINLPVLLATVLFMSARDNSTIPALIRQYVEHLRDALSKLSVELEADPGFQELARTCPEHARPN